MAGVNDTPEQARGLAAIALELGAHVNVIKLNATPLTDQKPPSESAARRFIEEVRRNGANITLRQTRGADIDAACGQLRIRNAKEATP